MSTATDASGIVLAGGKSRRLGRDKAVEPLGGRPLIQRVFDVLADVTDELVVVVNNADRGGELPLPQGAVVAVDAYPDAGSLGGIFTGLAAAAMPWGVVVACDMPFLNPRLLAHLLEQREGRDVVTPVIDNRPEPTHAAYSKSCLPAIEARIRGNELKISGFFDDVRVERVHQNVVERLDPSLLSFFNVNTEDDLMRAEAIISEGVKA